ncbi:DUF2812 domain-containing protein [Gorillibacterium sp. CAU 1737]|uniref:DUF2812 domain-containing protein n=1 Tax=Gorillibacterium sp. CAU 1737 TaxID=3140362 RepID=UPI003261114F
MKNKEKRYLPSSGLAFAEETIMSRLSKLAEEGWLLDSFAPLGFWLKRGEPQRLIYSLDMRDVTEDERRDYYDTFWSGGWTPVCSTGNIHIFAAAAGTPPIYSDRETHREKYIPMTRWVGWVALVSILLFGGVLTSELILMSGAEPLLNKDSWAFKVGLGLQGLTLMIGVPCLMMYVAYRWRLWKNR